MAQKLAAARWSKPFVKTKVTLDMAAIKKGLEGKKRQQLLEAGLSIVTGDEVFFIGRTEQSGTSAKIG